MRLGVARLVAGPAVPRGAAFALALALPFLPPAAAQGNECTIGEDGVRCQWAEPQEEPGAKSAGGSFWTSNTAQAVYALLGFAAAGGGAFYTRARVRRRRRTLSELLQRLNVILAQAQTDPGGGLARLAQLRSEVRARFDDHRLADGQFLELDKRVAEAIVRLRLRDLESRMPELPAALVGELRHLVADGVLSPLDVARIERHAGALGVPAGVRRQLAAYLEAWSGGRAAPGQDVTASQPAPVRRAAFVVRR